MHRSMSLEEGEGDEGNGETRLQKLFLPKSLHALPRQEDGIESAVAILHGAIGDRRTIGIVGVIRQRRRADVFKRGRAALAFATGIASTACTGVWSGNGNDGMRVGLIAVMLARRRVRGRLRRRLRRGRRSRRSTSTRARGVTVRTDRRHTSRFSVK